MKLSEDIEEYGCRHGFDKVEEAESMARLWADRARELEAELADTKAQLEYVRNTVRTQEEIAQELEAEVERLREAVRDEETCSRDGAIFIRELRAQLDAYRAAVADVVAFLKQFNDDSGDDADAVSDGALAILDKLPK